MKPSEKQNAAFVALIAMLIIALCLVSWNTAGAQDNPTPTPNCWVEDGQMVCIGEGPVATTATPTATPVIAPSPEATPEATPVVIRPFPLSPCKLSPGCALLPIAVTP
jgi:hypothetical protein